MRAVDTRAVLGLLAGVSISLLGWPFHGALCGALACASLPVSLHLADRAQQDLSALTVLNWRRRPFSMLFVALVGLGLAQLGFFWRTGVLLGIGAITVGCAATAWSTMYTADRPRGRNVPGLTLLDRTRVLGIMFGAAVMVGIGVLALVVPLDR